MIEILNEEILEYGEKNENKEENNNYNMSCGPGDCSPVNWCSPDDDDD